MRDPGGTDGSCKPRTRTSLREGAGGRRAPERPERPGAQLTLVRRPQSGGAGARSTLGQEERAREGGMKPGEEASVTPESHTPRLIPTTAPTFRTVKAQLN
uniref:Uncharacterized protein n=1 Tax=Rangifer tarandus platyrhynchus TaxID=3082113 RepID=A0ACB0F5T2_RANTA|nr:unnamed protein product [Rangifer tarandus platyrhynchus]